MDVSMRVEAVEAARDLLQRFRAAHADWQNDQTPLDAIANWLNCDIATFHPDDYPAGTYGFVEPGELLIWLCRDLPTTLHRFTLAHELGHVLLHSHIPTGHDLPARALNVAEVSPDDPCQSQDVREELTGLLSERQAEDLLGPGLAYDPRSQRELAANLFAAELLMPLERVWDLYVVQGVAPDALAARFAVSQAALLNRLSGLLTEPAVRQTPSGSLVLDEPAQHHTGTANDVTDAKQPIQQAEPATPAPTSAKKAYDEFQLAAIEAPTPALVVAGPGSGKTSTLIGRAEYLLQRQGVHPQSILALTFSRKAAQEMQERLQGILPAGQPAPTISTFHAFCAELLRTHGHRVGLRPNFALIDDAEGYFLLQSMAAEMRLNHYQKLQNPAAPFRDFLKAISRAKDELVTPARYHELASAMLAQAVEEEAIEAAERALEVAEIYELYQRGLMKRGDSDFGGLIMQTVQLLTDHADICDEIVQRYQHILVDEFQDINRASGVLLRLLASEQQRVWVVGDANQAIYGFRGASPANISRFQADYPNAVILPLSRNYRSRPDIVHLADTFKGALLEQDERIGAVQTARASQSEAYITLAVAPDEGNELRGLVRDIQAKLAEGYSSCEIVVLCRTRTTARKVTRELARAGLPVSVRGGMMEQEHTKNLLSLLLLMAEPSGMGILRAARLPVHQFSQADIEALLIEARTRQTSLFNLILREEAPLSMSAAGSRTLSRLAAIIKNLLHGSNTVWSLLARYLLQETTLGRELLTDSENPVARAMREDYADLLQFAHTYDQRQQEAQQRAEEEASERGEEPPPVPEMREQLRDFLAYLQILLSLRQEGDGKREANPAEGEAAPEIVRVMTVHASKGLEFPVVYLPGLAKSRFPLTKHFNATPPPAGMLPEESEGERAHESGEACLFYVGTTRARDQLILSHSERYGKRKANRSAYIDALVVGLENERVQRVLWQDDVGASAEEETEGESELLPPGQPSQTFIDIMRPMHLKAGQLEDYLTCPRRYAYSSIYQFHSSESDFLSFWQSTTETLKTLVEKMGEKPVSQEELAELYQHHWHAAGGEDGPFAHLYEQHGLEIAEMVRRQLAGEQESNWKLRQSLSIDLAGHTVEVTVDRVEQAGEGEQAAKFVRNRFGKSKTKPTPGTRDMLYLEAQRQHHPGQSASLHTHNLSTGERREVKISARKEESLRGDLLAAIEGIERQDFTPKPDAFTCASCPFFLICPA